MGNKQPVPVNEGGTSWSGIAKASQDTRQREDGRLAQHTDPVPVINTSKTNLPANLVLPSLQYGRRLLKFDLIAGEPCAVGIHVDDILIKDKTLYFPAGKHQFEGELELSEKNILTIALSDQQDSESSASRRTLKVTCRLKGENRLVVLGKQADIYGRVVDLEEVYGISGSEECVVCISEKPSTTLLPCRHMCACAECASFLMRMPSGERKCPVCRGLISSTVKVSTN